jgi:hypothetical protein
MKANDLPKGYLTRHVSHVKVVNEDGREAIQFNLVVENGKVETVETNFDRLYEHSPTVWREDQSVYAISVHQARVVLTEANRLKSVKSKDRCKTLKVIYRHTHSDYKGTFPDGTKSILTIRGLVALDSLTDEEIAERLPAASAKEIARLANKVIQA